MGWGERRSLGEGGGRIWLLGWILTPIPGLVSPDLAHLDLLQQFHWCKTKQPHSAAWGLPWGKGIHIPLPYSCLPCCVGCSTGQPACLPASAQVPIGLPTPYTEPVNCMLSYFPKTSTYSPNYYVRQPRTKTLDKHDGLLKDQYMRSFICSNGLIYTTAKATGAVFLEQLGLETKTKGTLVKGKKAAFLYSKMCQS